MPPEPHLSTHFGLIRNAASRGVLAFFYGAGINYPQCPKDRRFDETAGFCPTGAELARYLAAKYEFPHSESYAKVQAARRVEEGKEGYCLGCDFGKNAWEFLEQADTPALSVAAQYGQTMEEAKGYNVSYDLHQLFDRDFPSTRMHKLLARIPKLSQSDRLPVFITTNYDTIMERELARAGETFDVLFYRAPGAGTKVWLYHWANAHTYYRSVGLERPEPVREGWDMPVADFAGYDGLPIGDGLPIAGRADSDPKPRARTIIVKIHGTIAPTGLESSSFVVSNSDYVNFLRQVSAERPLPASLLNLLTESHFLFLGYGLGDWNILALFQNIWSARRLKPWKNYAIQFRPTEHDRAYWASEAAGKVTVIDEDIGAYADALEAALFPA